MERRIGILLLLGALSLGVWHAVFNFPEGGVLDVYVLDVGQGDSLYVRTPSGRDMLIDTGPGDRVIRELESVMPSIDRSIDIVVLTHTDSDHLGGMRDVLSRFSVGTIIEGGATASTSVYEQYHATAKKKHVGREIVQSGDVIVLDDNVRFFVYLPTPDDVRAKQSGEKLGSNDLAIVGKLQYGTSTLLLTADIERRGEAMLATSNANLASEVLKVAHHGSRYSSWEMFLDRVRPQISAISVGANRYGHPTDEALSRLQKTGTELIRTDQAGRIHLQSTGGQFTIVEE